MSMVPYIQKLAAAVKSGKKSALDDLCFEIEYEQLTKDVWPQAVFEFFVSALHDTDITSLTGARAFVLSLYNDFDKLTAEQRRVLLQTFGAEADSFGDEMLRHAASDLVARKYPPALAFDFFAELAGGGGPGGRHMALVGLELLLLSGKLDKRQATFAEPLLAELIRKP
ncbi:hypothetical protein NYO99_20790 [Pelomonas sp. UHG3]|uniref:Uncharacterized protein n=1 Tax=Roseateles hydrophilus TaxID=2975054 RepID=A0ACC6CGC6_9BURK|nr:hypothetical protein [Pelomonas sp. UHG3]